MSIGTTFGHWLRQRRRLLDLTQANLAGRVGCSEITIRKIEADERVPSERIAALLVESLEVPAAERPALIAFARGAEPCNLVTYPTGTSITTAAPPGRATCAGPPTPLTRLLGRDEDLARVRERLLADHVRVLTLIGPPGIGKTRLSLEVAELLRPHFADGVCFVALAPIRDSALVIPTLAQALGIHGGGEQLAALQELLQGRQMLLLLDNFEQVTAAAPQVAALLRTAPQVKVLATSRTALNISGEYLYAVPPLAHSDPRVSPAPGDIRCYPAVQLFAERVRAVRPEFILTPDNAPTVAEICARLDGLPLAIELAAARSRLFTPEALLDRLRQPSSARALNVLVNGPRDLLEHQRTLRGTIEWSYDLLNQDEQAVFMSLSIFVGGCTLEAAEAVTADLVPQLPMLQVLLSLVNQSLLQVEHDNRQTRFIMLETIRAYGTEKLAMSGRLPGACQRHAAYYATRALNVSTQSRSAEREHAIDQLRADSNNIRAALAWYLDYDPDTGMRCAAALRPFWFACGLLNEGRSWLTRFLAQAEARPVSAEARAQALSAAGFLAQHQGDHPVAESHMSDSLALYRQLDDTRGIADALLCLGSSALLQSSFSRAESLTGESLALYRQLGSTAGVAEALRVLALIAKDRGDLARAARLGEECLALHRQLGDRRVLARTLFNLSTIAYWQSEYDRSESLAAQAAHIFDELGDQMGLAYALEGIGMVAYKQGNHAEALRSLAKSFDLLRELDEKVGMALVFHEMGLIAHARDDDVQAAQLHRDGLALARRIGDQRRVAFCLEGLAGAVGARRPLDAARLLGAAEALREALGAPIPEAGHADYEHDLAAIRAGADRVAFAEAWDEGRTLPLDEVVSAALNHRSWATPASNAP